MKHKQLQLIFISYSEYHIMFRKNIKKWKQIYKAGIGIMQLKMELLCTQEFENYSFFFYWQYTQHSLFCSIEWLQQPSLLLS